MSNHGIIAAGHEETAKAAEIILRDGGNAFDAIVAASAAAFVCEPVLTSAGGGGFLLAQTSDEKQIIYDFFVQTPQQKKAVSEIDFYPISADFGTTIQEFHIGLGSIATPGTIRGLFAIHRDLCSVPIKTLFEPAIELAKKGVTLNAFHAYIFQIVSPIYSATPSALKIYGGSNSDNGLIGEGETLKQTQLADTLEILAHEGDALFYQGEIAQRICQSCAENGGHLNAKDLSQYQVIKRTPLQIDYQNVKLFTNPPPSAGGILISFALALLNKLSIREYEFGTRNYLDLLALMMKLTNKARMDAYVSDSQEIHADKLLNPEFVRQYRQQILGRAQSLRGTTHISVMDNKGNIASLSQSNGEGCGHMIPETGIMLNNMLGEEDLNTKGFHQWLPDQRMTSMMSPSILQTPEGFITLGSGGSNRIRTAILQVLINLVEFGMTLEGAVKRPRIHYENGLLSIEGGFDNKEIEKLLADFPEHKVWESQNLFFGGTHCVSLQDGTFYGVGDPRRGGVAITVT